MRVDKKLVESLYKKHVYKDNQGIKTNWIKITQEYQEIKGLPYKPKRDQLRWAVHGKSKELYEKSLIEKKERNRYIRR